jgi:DNA-directed RNA polymerase subunit RPC12/RpoP
MKFLCVSCDEPMKLAEARPPERGSLTVVYRCPHCSHEIAMLTNPYETQVVGSLGVAIGGDPGEAEASKCPFTSVVRDMGIPLEASSFPWTSEALSRLENIPEFARPMAKTGIEKYAVDRGLTQIDAEVLEQAREFFGM